MADKTFYKNKIVCGFWLAMIVVASTILFGLRDFGVGTDTLIYTESYFYEAGFIRSFHAFSGDVGSAFGDKGYLLLAIITTKLFHKAQGLLITTSLFTLTFFILGMYRYKKILGMRFSIFIIFYCLVLSAPSLNYMRQFCAMSLLFWGFSFFLQGSWKIYLILQVAAYFFHSSSVFFVIVPAIYYVSQMKDIKRRNLITLAGFIMLFVIMGSFFYFISLFGDLGIIRDVYADRYGEQGGNVATESFQAGKTMILLVANNLLMIYLTSKYKALDKPTVYLIFVFFALTTILQYLGLIVHHMHRMSLYVGIVYYAYLALMYDSRKVPSPFKLLGYMLFAYLWMKNATGGANEIYPYTSKILGIG